jgi:aminoglycoside phosphotransferase (APT) family kinase protein
MGSIPTSVEHITPAWLAAATGLPIEDASLEQIGVGIGVSSAVYRAHLSGPDCPETVVIKLPALDEAAVFTSTVLRMYTREAGFFDELAHEAPVRVPACHHTSVDHATSEFVLVMEDIGHLRAVDQIEGMAVADAERAVDGLAAWHATWWGRADELATSGLTVSLGDEIYKQILPMVFPEGWAKLNAEIDVPAAVVPAGEAWVEVFPGILDALAEGPTTMTHGDYRADNLFFDDDGTVVPLDFQLIGTGRAAYDLAYFTTQSLAPADATAHEAGLFDRWKAGLIAGGVAEVDVASAWDDYRQAALFCLAYPVVAWRGMDVGDPRQRLLAEVMLDRFARAVTELDLDSLL